MEDLDRDQAALMKSLRLAAGLEAAELGAQVNLSAGQIRQLEDGGDSLFYSPQIKDQALRRVIRFLETPQPSGKPTKVQSPELVPRQSTNVIDDIIRLSEKNLKGNVVSSPVKRPFHTKKWLMLFGLIALGVCVLWWSKRQASHAVFSNWVVAPLTQRLTTEPATPLGVETTTAVQPPFKDVPTSTTVVNSAVDLPSPSPSPQTANNVPPVAPVSPPAMANVAPDPVVINPPAKETTKPDTPTPIKAASEMAKASKQDSQSEQATDKKSDNDCASIKGEPLEARSVLAAKPGNYVYVVASKPVQVCIEDAQHHRTVLTLEAGTGRSVHGNPPWVVASRQLKSVQIYFQGAKVGLPADTDSRIILKEQAVSP